MDQQQATELYRLYVERVMKEGEWLWARFNIYLSLNTGMAVITGVLLENYLADLPFDVPFGLWGLCCVVCLVGVWVAYSWQRVNEDSLYWQSFIIRLLADFERNLFPEQNGLYAAIWQDAYPDGKLVSKDVGAIKVPLACFFRWLWTAAFVLSIFFLVVTV